MGKTKEQQWVNPLQRKADAQFYNQNSKNIRKEQNWKKANGIDTSKKFTKQGAALPNLAFHKQQMKKGLERKQQNQVNGNHSKGFAL